jgi:plasmid stabilization system protein ParE
VILSPRAKRELIRIVEWWKENAGGPPANLFAELTATAQRLGELPHQGTRFATVRGRVVLRVLLRESQVHVYYRVDEDAVRVLALWSTARKRTPRFGPVR